MWMTLYMKFGVSSMLLCWEYKKEHDAWEDTVTYRCVFHVILGFFFSFCCVFVRCYQAAFWVKFEGAFNVSFSFPVKLCFRCYWRVVSFREMLEKYPVFSVWRGLWGSWGALGNERCTPELSFGSELGTKAAVATAISVTMQHLPSPSPGWKWCSGVWQIHYNWKWFPWIGISLEDWNEVDRTVKCVLLRVNMSQQGKTSDCYVYFRPPDNFCLRLRDFKDHLWELLKVWNWK